MPLLPCQPHPAPAVVAEALHGQDLWLALATATHPSIAPVWGTDPSLEPSQLLRNTQEEGLLADTPGVPPPSSEGGQHVTSGFDVSLNSQVKNKVSWFRACSGCPSYKYHSGH